MNSTAIVPRVPAHNGREYLPAVSADAVEQALAIGDMAKMSVDVRVAYYVATCQSAGLNPMTRPFDLIKGDDGTIRLYPNKVAAEQLRKMHRVSILVKERRMDVENGLYVVTVQVSTPDGRQDEAQGIVDIAGKKGTALANTLLRCETKAKRRATLSLCGLGYEDSEDAGHPVHLDYQQGGLADDEPLALASGREDPSKAADDLFGDGAGDRMRQHQAHAEIGAITQLWVGYGLTPAQIDNYWEKQCRRFAVSAPGDIPELDRRYKEVAQWITEHPSDSDENADTPGQQEDDDDIPEFSPSSAEGDTHA